MCVAHLQNKVKSLQQTITRILKEKKNEMTAKKRTIEHQKESLRTLRTELAEHKKY